MDIFIIEDDKSLSDEIKLVLNKWGYKVGQVNNFENITNEVLECNPKLILMDINLPSYDGFYWCSQIRNFMKLPIIFISSRDNDMDIIMSINMGGDDYITKPFSPQVLVAKIQAILRRTYSYNKDLKSDIIKFKDVTLNIVEGKPFISLAFEAVSAMATVGSSLGITATLGVGGKLIIILLMYVGRIGISTLILSLTRPKPGLDKSTKVSYPNGNIIVG